MHKEYSFTHIPPVFKRGHQVMLAIFDPDQRLHLARKPVYPPGIYRFFGGGIETGETTNQAATRECREETGLLLPFKLQHTFTATLTELQSNQSYFYQAELFYGQLQSQSIHPGDDVASTQSFSKLEFQHLIDLYQTIPIDLATGKQGKTFRWSDWGLVFNDLNQYVFHHWPED